MQIIARRYDTDEPITLEVADGKIASISDATETSGNGPLPIIAPGFVDLQVNGYDGVELASPDLTVDQVQRLVIGMHSCGVTAFLPTVTTHSREIMLHAIRMIGDACNRGAKSIAGIHVEGPFLSAEDGPRGAHPTEHVRAPDLDEYRAWQNASGGSVKIITIAPETDGAFEFIEAVVDDRVTVAIGHTAATPEQIAAAVDAGATMSTHLGNGAHGTIRRHPNYIWSQLDDDRLTASLIADGFHLPPEVLRVMLRAKTSARCVLVSDVTGMAGQPPGRYSTSLGEVEVLEDGRLVVADQRQYLAGAALPIGPCIFNAMRVAGLTRKQAIELASVQPAQLIGAQCGRLEVGSPADLVLFDCNDELIVRRTIVGGDEVFS